MRIFTIATLATVVLGVGTALAVAEPAVTSPSPTASQYVSVERALQRLELEAELEDFYSGLRARAAGLSQAEREELYREAERELAALIHGSPSYAGAAPGKRSAYLAQARVVLLRELGLAAPPA